MTAPRALHVYATAAAIGLVTFLVVYGPGHLAGTSAYWDMPTSDERMYLIGYRYFLHEPWHWPLFTSYAVDAPYAKSLVFLDCIPLWALVNKLIAAVIPPWRAFSAQAYLGLWHGLVYALQPCLGVACLRALGHRSWRTAIVTALFFLAIPCWIFRYGHAALSAHWIELWALYLYLRTPAGARQSRQLGVAKLAQLAVASLVTPYHAVMSFGLFVASLWRTRQWREGAAWLALGVASIALPLAFAGYFAPETATRQWGFSVESANVLSWFVPVRSGIAGDGRWIANVLATNWQWEGYAYLGLGYLGLLAIVAWHARSLRGVVRRHAGLLAIAVAFGLLSLSSHVYFGSHRVLAYRFPHVLHVIPDQFRSPGRFIWVPTYVLIVYVLHWAYTRFSVGRRFAVVVIALAVQLVDARAEWSLQHAWVTGPNPWPSHLDHGPWRMLIAAHDRVVIEPTYSCVTNPDLDELHLVSTELEALVSERALPINGTYSTRPTRDCAAEPQPTLDPGTLYVLLPQADAFAARLGHCAVFAYGHVCSTNEAALTFARAEGIVH